MTRMKKPIDCSLLDDPIEEFKKWQSLAISTGAVSEAMQDMVLSTATRKGKPSSRVVLFKGIEQGRIFVVTNYKSRKAREMSSNAQVSIVFYYPGMKRQVRMEGRAKKATRSENLAYFATRPRDSQIGAWASIQSSVIATRSELEKKVESLTKKFEGKEVPCPPHWGGFWIEIETVEFWLDRPNRLHDRFRYTRKSKKPIARWQVDRLSP